MKTAVSIPDELFEEAEKAARRLGVSRSRLYATALRRYLAQQQAGDVTARLNAIYSEIPSEMEEGWLRLQAEVLARDDG